MMMMFASSSQRTAIAATSLFAIILSVLSVSVSVSVVDGQLNVMSMIPDDILNGIPEECRGNAHAFFDLSVTCAIENLAQCIGIISLVEEFGNIPSAENITDCIDINEPFCTFADACTVCAAEFEDLVNCIVLNSVDTLLTQNQTDYIESCSLSCD
jgi:hypothetical protein